MTKDQEHLECIRLIMIDWQEGRLEATEAMLEIALVIEDCIQGQQMSRPEYGKYDLAAEAGRARYAADYPADKRAEARVQYDEDIKVEDERYEVGITLIRDLLDYLTLRGADASRLHTRLIRQIPFHVEV